MSETVSAGDPERTSRRRQGRGYRRGGVSRWITAGLLGLIVVGTPAALGAVHRPFVLATVAACVMLALAAGCLAARSGQEFRPHIALALPACFIVIAAIQSVPLPASLRARLDPVGSDLADYDRAGPAVAMSLDPPATHAELAKAGAAAAVAFAALILSAGRRLRLAAPSLVALAGIATLAIGLGHRALVEDRVYGRFNAAGGLPIGPFINPNNEAELLELSAFVALALAYAAPTRDRRRVWLGLAALLAGGALSTLSRGSVLALGAGALTWGLFPVRTENQADPRRGRRPAMALAGLAVVAGVALSLGGDRILTEIMATRAGQEGKLRLWIDAAKMVAAHPLGIGLGAFARVYPAYQTALRGSWYQFVENQPLGLIIEAGIPGALLVAAAVAFTIRHLARRARRDHVEAALCAALMAVLAHNWVDFGLELPGVLLPFLAILGAVLGRQQVAEDHPLPKRSGPVFAGLAAGASLAGLGLLLLPSARDFDALIAHSPPADRPALALAGLAAHPTDNVYALAAASVLPLRGEGGDASPRLRMLNHALRLCPGCTGGHREAARNLWQIGRRQQALLEWRGVVAMDRLTLRWVLDELRRSGARPDELAGLADDQNRFELCQYLLAQHMIEPVKQLLAAAPDQTGLEPSLVRFRLALLEGEMSRARLAAKDALAAAPGDPRAVLAAAEVETADHKPEVACEILRSALHLIPTDVNLNRKLLELLMKTDRWAELDRALDGLRAALLANGVSLVEAQVAAAQVFERRGQYVQAVSEYRAATAQSPGNVGLLLALGRTAEMAGQVTVALDAYRSVLRQAPNNAAARDALTRMRTDSRGKVLEEILQSQAHAQGM